MTHDDHDLSVFLHLARASQARRHPLVRDKMLVMAGALAAERGLEPIAACCRQRILEHNPGHMLSRFATFEEAMEDEDFHIYLQRLARNYPREKTEHMLDRLGIQIGQEHEAYFDSFEYAAALLGTTPEGVQAELEQNGDRRTGGVPAAAVPTERTISRKALVPWLLAGVALLAAAGLGLVLWASRR